MIMERGIMRDVKFWVDLSNSMRPHDFYKPIPKKYSYFTISVTRYLDHGTCLEFHVKHKFKILVVAKESTKRYRPAVDNRPKILHEDRVVAAHWPTPVDVGATTIDYLLLGKTTVEQMENYLVSLVMESAL